MTGPGRLRHKEEILKAVREIVEAQQDLAGDGVGHGWADFGGSRSSSVIEQPLVGKMAIQWPRRLPDVARK